MESGEQIAAGRLEAALAEQARLQDAYWRAAGTTAEMSSYVRLQASNLRVAGCERMAARARPESRVEPEGSDAPSRAE